MRIDAHHHFWHYDPVEYDWISDEMRSIRRDFLPVALEPTIRAAGVDGVVTVQARQSLEETDWLLELAGKHEFIRGVVGWVPLISLELEPLLARLVRQPKLKSVRHVLQGEPDPEYMLRPDFNRGVSLLRRFDLAYDILILERQLPETLRFVDQHPEQRFVLDHVAKPRIRDNVLSPWAEQMRELARRPNVWCKLSGMVTEANFSHWTEAQLQPYLEIALAAFGPQRVMFGSDWPVCLVACEYGRWYGIVRQFLSTLSVTEQDAVLGGNAVIAYRLTIK